MIFTVLSCSHIRQLPPFPESKILRVNLPRTMIVGKEYKATCWVNDAPDSVVISIAYVNPVDNEEMRFFRDAWKTENPESAPVLGPTWTFVPMYEVMFVFEFTAKNKWSQDYVKIYTQSVGWAQPRGIPGIRE